MVSIITPCYNSEAYIEETYQSIAAQTYTDWEWIVIDDSSTDDSVSVIKSIRSKDSRVRLLSNTGNKGPGGARNTGIKAANRRFIAFIDSDDLWFPEFLEKSIAKAKATGAGFVYSSVERWNEDLTVYFNDAEVPEKITYKELLYTCPIVCSTVLIDIEKHGKRYMPDLPKRQDYALWLDYLKVIPFAVGNKEPLGKYRVRKSSISGNKWKVIKHQFNVYHKHQKVGLPRSLFYTLTWAYYGFMKYRKVKE